MLYNKQIFKRCFHHPKRYWYKNIKYIPLYFKLINDLVKNGYDEYATWEMFNWFIDTMKPILTEYNSIRSGTGIVIDNYFELQESGVDADEENEKVWNGIINKMIELLDLMDECNPKYDSEEYQKDYKKKDAEMCAAKDEFFKLFSRYFYYLWD